MNTPYRGLGNTFRKALLAHERLYGCWASLANPISTEIVGYAGFDWILLDAEHSPNDLSVLHLQLLALKDSPSAPVVRPQTNDPVLLKRMLDLGFYNFLIPMVETADQARLAVMATRYPPDGIRGVSVSQRSNRYGNEPDYFTQINSSICVMVQVETPKGIVNVDEIADVDGVDGIFIGPQDLAATYGHLLNPSHADVQDAIEQATTVCLGKGKPVGILAPIEADARRYLDMGMTFVAIGGDQGLLKESTKKLVALFARI